MDSQISDISKKLFKGAGTIGAVTFLSRTLGFARDAVIAMVFGAGLYSDLFFLCFRIPNLLRKLFSEGVMSISFIPVYTECLTKHGKKNAFDMARSAFFMVSVFVSIFVISGIILAPFIVRFMGSGFEPGSYKFALTVLLSRIMMPYILCISLLALCMGILNSMGRFAAPAAAPVVLNIVIIIFALIVSPRLSIPVTGLAMGVTAGGILQLALQIPFIAGTGLDFFKKTVFFHPKAVRAGKRLIPAMIGASAFQINIFISTIMAASLSMGSISYLYYADRLVQFPLALFAFSVSIALFPELSKNTASGKTMSASEQFTRGSSLVFFITIPAMAGLIALRRPIVSLLFQNGAFNSTAVNGTADALFFLATGLWAFAGTRLFVTLFHAFSNIKTPFNAGLAAIGSNIVLSFILMQHMGYQGLALSVSTASAINFFILLKYASPYLNASLWREMMVSVCKSILGSCVMSASIFFAASFINFGQTAHKSTVLFSVTGLVFLGISVYAGVSAIMGSNELQTIKNMIKKG